MLYKLEREDRHHILRGIRYTYADFCPVSAEQLYGRQTTVREMNQLLIGMDSNALREFLNPEGADSEKLCQERATEQEYYQGKESLVVFHAFEKAYGNIENGDSHRYEKALKEGLCGEPDTGRESSSYNRHYVWDFRGNLLKQKDSLGGTWKYAYCSSNPVMYADPSGYAKSIVPVNELSYEEVKKELNDIYADFVKKKKSNVPSISNKLLKTELDYGNLEVYYR